MNAHFRFQSIFYFLSLKVLNINRMYKMLHDIIYYYSSIDHSSRLQYFLHPIAISILHPIHIIYTLIHSSHGPGHCIFTIGPSQRNGGIDILLFLTCTSQLILFSSGFCSCRSFLSNSLFFFLCQIAYKHCSVGVGIIFVSTRP